MKGKVAASSMCCCQVGHKGQWIKKRHTEERVPVWRKKWGVNFEKGG